MTVKLLMVPKQLKAWERRDELPLWGPPLLHTRRGGIWMFCVPPRVQSP